MRIIPFEKKEETEELVRIAVLPYGPSAVKICAVDKHGDPIRDGHLLDIDQNGIRRYKDVSGEIGIKLTGNKELYLVS